MGDRFGQFDGPVHRGHWPSFDLDPDQLLAVGTPTTFELAEGQFASPFFLDGSAEPLPHFMRRQLDLVIMRHSVSLLDRLQLSGQFGRLLQMHFKFFPHLCLFRVHAISPQNIDLRYLPPLTRLLYYNIPQISY
jgi:hypothetical protein